MGVTYSANRTQETGILSVVEVAACIELIMAHFKKKKRGHHSGYYYVKVLRSRCMVHESNLFEETENKRKDSHHRP